MTHSHVHASTDACVTAAARAPPEARGGPTRYRDPVTIHSDTCVIAEALLRHWYTVHHRGKSAARAPARPPLCAGRPGHRAGAWALRRDLAQKRAAERLRASSQAMSSRPQRASRLATTRLQRTASAGADAAPPPAATAGAQECPPSGPLPGAHASGAAMSSCSSGPLAAMPASSGSASAHSTCAACRVRVQTPGALGAGARRFWGSGTSAAAQLHKTVLESRESSIHKAEEAAHSAERPRRRRAGAAAAQRGSRILGVAAESTQQKKCAWQWVEAECAGGTRLEARGAPRRRRACTCCGAARPRRRPAWPAPAAAPRTAAAPPGTAAAAESPAAARWALSPPAAPCGGASAPS